MSPLLRQLLKRLGDRQIVGAVEWLVHPAKRESWGGPFNGQPGRLEFFDELLGIFEPEVIVETGTFRGTTTAYMAARSGLPVWSVEVSPRAVGFARLNLVRFPRVRVTLGDSVQFLRDLVREGRWSGARSFVYLDAHWGPDLPLVRELEAILGSDLNAIVAIDDFCVPGDPGYAFDSYGPDAILDQSLIASTVTKFGASVYFPSRPSESEGGARRGMVCLANHQGAVSALARMSTLRSF